MSDHPRASAAPFSTAVTAFRALHASGCFVLPNPWDVGSAIALHRLGFPALATTSAGVSFARGLPDRVDSLSCDAMLAHVREIVEATPLPVNADLQDGYARAPEGVATNVTRCVRTGAAGLSIEDASGDPAAPLLEADLALERVRAARAAIDASGSGALLTARCEAWLVGHPEPEKTALERLTAFAEAGADCLYAPGVREPRAIAALVRAVAPRPLNVLVGSPGVRLSALAELGVRRVSLGSALARTAWGAFLRAARGLAGGDLSGLEGAAAFQELDALFTARPGRATPAPVARFTFRIHPERLAIVRLPPEAELPSWARGSFVSLTRTRDELSVVCAERETPRALVQARGRVALGIVGTIPMETVGVLAALCGLLAAAGVPVYALSTHDTDWLLVAAEHLEGARAALLAAGHAVEGERPRA